MVCLEGILQESVSENNKNSIELLGEGGGWVVGGGGGGGGL